MNAFLDFLAIPEAPVSRPVLDRAIYVEPTDKDPASEDARQIVLVNWMKREAPHIAVHATPNGGRQSDWARIRGQKMGVYAGWPDLTFDWPGGSAHIEMKDGGGKPSGEQIECLNRLHRMGKHVAICRTRGAAIAWLRGIGCPLREALR